MANEFWKMVVVCKIMRSSYIMENGKLYHVKSVTENTKVFEIACTGVGENTIKKKEKCVNTKHVARFG